MSERSSTATLMVSCPDRKGLVAALATLLADHGANIVRAQQHTDGSQRRFFQRIQFELADLAIDREALEGLLRIECARYDMQWRIAYGDRIRRVALFVSRSEHCLWDLFLRHRLGELRCEIVCVISNHPDLEPVARQFGVPFHLLPITPETRSAQEARQLEICQGAAVDLIVLARYMQILSEDFIRHFPERIINIHHSFLPAFAGARPYHQAFERGVKLIGATAHYATADLDEGPIIAQEVVRASHRDSIADLVRKGRDVERAALAAAVRAHLEDRIWVHGRRTIVF
ncbi:MAG: formyltetrahydrofolate deformylase [Myxococcota bacterium]